MQFSSQVKEIQKDDQNETDDEEFDEYEYEDESDLDIEGDDENINENVMVTTSMQNENEYENEYDEDDDEEEEFIYGEDSDDEFTDTLDYDVRDDPWWDEMLPQTQQKFLYMQRHKNPEAWPDQIIPHAAKTSNFNHFTLSYVHYLFCCTCILYQISNNK